MRVLRAILLASAGLFAEFGAVEPGAADRTVEDGSALTELLWPSGRHRSRTERSGRPIDGSALLGKTVVVSFVSAHCAIECVARLMDLGEVARSLPRALRDDTRIVVVSTDPARDDAPTLRRFVDGLGADLSSLILLSSTREETDALARLLHYPTTNLPEPPALTFLFDRTGDVVMTYSGAIDPPRILDDVAAVASLARRRG